MTTTETFYLAALAACPGIGSQKLTHLSEFFGRAEDAWCAAEDAYCEAGLTVRFARTLADFVKKHPQEPERIASDCQRLGINVIAIDDDRYPPILKEIYNPPHVLYYRGTIDPQAERIAVVGSRRFSPYGEAAALDLAEKTAAAGFTIVSGAARGIDTSAHKGALKTGRTVAILGCGCDIAYPAQNRRLLDEIAAKGGAVISEYRPGTQPLPAFFPARNRIIAGLARGTLVVEAARRSGSLITAELALGEGRDVFAVPGSIFSRSSEGCHDLIRQGARLVSRAQDILAEYGKGQEEKRPHRPEMTLAELRVYQVLSFDRPLAVDEIIQSLVGEVSNLPLVLMQMQQKGLILENELHAYRRAERE